MPAAILGLGEDTSWWLTVGPTLSGTLPHYHRPAMNVLARGRKRWAIYVGANLHANNRLKNEGLRDYGIGTQAKDWFVRECPNLRSRRRVQLWEFAQEAGDLVYIPSFFIHAVVNLEPVVGFSVMFYQPKDRAALAEHRQLRSSEGVACTAHPYPVAASGRARPWALGPRADRICTLALSSSAREGTS